MRPGDDELMRAIATYFADLEDGDCSESERLARLAADDLSPAERAAFAEHLRACGECRAHLERFTALERELDPAASSGARATGRRFLARGFRRLVPAAAALAAAIILVVAAPDLVSRWGDPGLHAKGAWRLSVVTGEGAHARVVPDGAIVDSGSLGFFYSAAAPGYLAILYGDESGEVTWLFPSAGSRSAVARAGERVRVPDGATLTPGHGCEWVIGIFSTAALSRGAATEVATDLLRRRRGCALPGSTGEGMNVQVVTIRRS